MTSPHRLHSCVSGYRQHLAVLLLALVAGCGGGGGGGGGGAGTGGGSGGSGGLVAPAPTPGIPGTSATWDIYQATVPPTVTTTTSADHATLDAPTCRITLWKPVATGADLATQALSLLQQAFSDPSRWSGMGGQALSGDVLADPSHLEGTTAQGFRYVDLSVSLKNASGQWSNEHARIQLTDVDGQAAAMIGYQPTTQGCLTDPVVPNEFEWLYVSLSMTFPSHPGDISALGKQLVGTWAYGGGGIGMADVYAANGQHINAMTDTTYSQPTADMILETTSSWVGSGNWAVKGNLLTVWPKESGQAPVTHAMQIYKVMGGSFRWTYVRWLDMCGPDICALYENKTD